MTGEPNANPKRKHVHTIRKRLADGTIKVYRYHRKSNRPIDGAPGSKRFAESYEKAKAAAPTDVDSLASLVTLFKGSAEYKTLAAKTKKDYDRYLDELRDRFGDLSFEALEDKRVREDFYAWRDERIEVDEEGQLIGGTRAADYAWAILRRVLSIAVKRGKLAINHALTPGSLHTVDRSDKILEPDQLIKILAVSSIEFRDVVMAAVLTFLRQGDLCLLSWAHWKDGGDVIRFKTSKRKRAALIPVHTWTRKWLEQLPRRGTVMLTTTTGMAWKPDYVRNKWQEAREKAGLGESDLHFHDLRGLGITIASEAGCSTQMIAAAAGLSLKQVEAILDRYSARTKRLAGAMKTVIESQGSPFLTIVSDASR